MITWDETSIGGTSLRGYLHGKFETMKAKLQALSGQTGECDCGDGKVEIEFIGTLDGQTFTIYDYKGEREPLHIGGLSTLDMPALKLALADVGIVSNMEDRWK